MSIKDSLRALASALGAESEAKSIKGILREIAVAEEAEGTGRTVADLVMEIAVAKGYEPPEESNDSEPEVEPVVEPEIEPVVEPSYTYTPVQSPDVAEISTYYENVGTDLSPEYELTSDVAIDETKTYYTRSEANG